MTHLSNTNSASVIGILPVMRSLPCPILNNRNIPFLPIARTTLDFLISTLGDTDIIRYARNSD
ncbi:uncharacterized protein K441DRAFT_653850 [Cenococcum geophilum 1.58]|uniref:uncharacterized protein n=1 Tax=Cenococcum geophilum 1.58 TaxID=794803 RepID=UPI00358E3647|nr:hypothetical protein K441DRAFT_653850 [Cenococcum geophilum 1.58]